MRAMGDLKTEFSQQGVQFVAVNVMDTEARARAFIDGSEMDYTWVRAGDREAREAGISSVPALVVLDAAGDVAWRSSIVSIMRGPEALRPVLTRLLDES